MEEVWGAGKGWDGEMWEGKRCGEMWEGKGWEGVV